MSKIIFLLFVFVLGAVALDPITNGIVSNIQSMMDPSVNPCEDFYLYSCGSFISQNPPPNSSAPYIYMPAFTGIMNNNDKLLSEIVNDPYPFVNDVYQSCMATPNTTSAQEMLSIFNETIFNANISTDLPKIIGYLNRHGVRAFFEYTVSANETTQQQNVVYLMPDGFDYLVEFNSSYYIDLIMQYEIMFGIDPATAKQDAAAVSLIESWIAQASIVPYEMVVANQNLSDVTGFDFVTVNAEMGLNWGPNDQIVVQSPITFYPYLTTITNMFSEEDVKIYLRWRVIEYLAVRDPSVCLGDHPNIYACMYIESYYPNPAPYTQDVVCRYKAYDLLSDYVGLLFSNMIVNDDLADDIRDMTTGIQKAFGSSLNNLTWLDAISLDSVIFKLEHIVQIIGHPNVLDNPNTNTINFPAGILESPMFSGSWSKIFQYSRLGYVVGHENTHGFDNQGSQYNAYGLPGDDAATSANFNASAQCVADYYSQFVVFGNTHLNGQQTLPENIADIGGVKNSFRAYQNWIAANGPEFQNGELISGLTTNQVFFLHMGQTWCTSENEAYLALELKSDVHSPSKFRVNGALSQFDKFAEVWNCPAGSPMNPTSRCDLW